MILKIDSVITTLLIFAGLFQLSMLGLLPYGFKFVGDAFLLIVFIIGMSKGLLKPLLGKINVIAYLTSVFFLFYTTFMIIYSIILWHEISSTFLWGRRWIISGLYLLFSSTEIAKNIKNRIFLRVIIVSSIITMIAIVLKRDMGFDLQGITSSTEFQGRMIVTKIFNPGNFLIMVTTILIVINFIIKTNFRFLFLSFLYVATFMNLINFRSWWMALFIGIAISIILVFISIKRKRKFFLFTISLLILLSTIITLSSDTEIHAADSRLKWISSAIDDFKNNDGNMGTRYDKDVSRLINIWEGNDSYYKVLGTGFMANNSNGHKYFGFTSETNDSGWVEVMLTGGICGSIVITLLWVFHLLRIFQNYKKYPSAVSVGLLVIWLLSLPLMISSNLLLWDFGFVPIAWMYLISFNISEPGGVRSNERAS